MFSFERERESTREHAHTSRGEGQREGDRESEAGSVLTAVSPDVGLELMNREIMI